VKNFDDWCHVSVNGTALTTATTQTVCVAAGTVTLSATPANASFELGPTPWHDTAGDTGAGDPGTVANGADSTTVVVSGAKCVWVCCPFSGSGTGCPTTDQCP
jgi:hypothetical protein